MIKKVLKIEAYAGYLGITGYIEKSVMSMVDNGYLIKIKPERTGKGAKGTLYGITDDDICK